LDGSSLETVRPEKASGLLSIEKVIDVKETDRHNWAPAKHFFPVENKIRMEVKEISTYIADLKQIFETGNFFGKTALDSKDLLSLIVFNQINIYPNKCSFKVWLPLLKLEPSRGQFHQHFTR